MLWPRCCASKSRAKVESPPMLMRAMGSIWTAIFSFIIGPLLGGASGAGIECRRQMARQASGRNQHGVKTQFEFGMFGMVRQPGLRGVDDALLLARRHRPGRVIDAGPGLDLDKGNQVSPARNDIDFAI